MIPKTGITGLYPREGDDPRLVCLRGTHDVVVRNFRLANDACLERRQAMKALIGKDVKARFVFNGYTDQIVVEGYPAIITAELKPGTAIDVGYPIIKTFRGRKQFDAHLEKWPPSKKGVAVIEKAIDEVVRVPITETDKVEV